MILKLNYLINLILIKTLNVKINKIPNTWEN